LDDIGIAFEDAVAEMVLAQELPDVLDGVQLGRNFFQIPSRMTIRGRACPIEE
jgi:hypothetical protein